MKSLKKLGKVLNREEQKKITGGFGGINPFICYSGQQCATDNDCCFGEQCHLIQYGYPKVCN